MIILRRDREGGGQKSESLDKKNAQIFFGMIRIIERARIIYQILVLYKWIFFFELVSFSWKR